MTAWEIEIRRDDKLVVLVSADSLRKCVAYLIRHVMEVPGR